MNPVPSFRPNHTGRISRVGRTFRSVLALALLGLVTAVSVALATPAPQPRAGSDAASRAVGRAPRFTLPFLMAGSDPEFPEGGNSSDDPEGFDLGDAYPGDTIQRTLTAAGGFQPYRFTRSLFIGSGVASELQSTPVVPDVSLRGDLAGAIDSNPGSFLRFGLNLDDVIGSQRTATARVFVRPAFPRTFLFAHDRLPRGERGNHYFTTLQTIGNPGDSVTYAVVPGTVVSGTSTFARLEETGLVLQPDGTLYGRPVLGDVAFAVTATSSTGIAADSRNGSTVGRQNYTLNVGTNAALTSELSATAVSVKGNRSRQNGDSFSYTGVLDTRGLSAPELAASTLTVRLGTATFSATFDDKGRAKSAQGTVAFSAQLQPAKGRFTVKLTGATLGSALGISDQLTGSSVQPLILCIETARFRTSEVLSMETSALDAGAFRMQYQLGKRGFSRAGSMQILSVAGSPAKQGSGSDAPAAMRWLVRTLAVPGQLSPGSAVPPQKFAKPTAGSTVDGVSTATVAIGSNFSQTVSLTKKNVRREFKATSEDAGLFRVLLDPVKFIHRIETNPLTPDETGIPNAIETKDINVFPLGLSGGGFSAETGRVIAPNREAWQQK